MTKNSLKISGINFKMPYIFIFLLSISTLFAGDSLLDLYQKEGSSSVEKIFDQELASKAYWENRLKNIDTRFGYFEGVNYLLACNKENTNLKLYAKDANNTFKLDSDFSAFVGKKAGDKEREGDLKTPIGVYKLIQKLDKVDPFYGPLAFVTSYPNTYDKVRGKNGSGIWVHGLPLNQERDDYTKGCIAVNNNNLKHIEDQINVKDALVYIDQDEYPEVRKESLITILSQLYKWRKAWKENDTETYLSFYDSNFKRSDGLRLERFKQYKRRIFAKDEYKQILFSKINILPYPTPDNNNTYLISFHEDYQSYTYKFNGSKELYIHLNNENISIIAEK